MTVRVGIDLGTTNSLVAVDRDGRIDVLETVPSIVAETAEGTLLVGVDAATVDGPRHRHSHFKRSMGTDTRFEFSPAVEGPKTAPELSALVLRRLAETAASKLGVPVRDLEVVITVPADFRDNARAATREAAALAGLRLLDLVVEPVAAAAAYAADRPLTKESETLLVYDLGGGTFDACICVRTPGSIVIGANQAATKGHQTLGGRDLDAAFVGHVLKLNDRFNLDDLVSAERLHASQTAADVWALRQSAERQREKLSEAESVFARLRLGATVLSAQVKRASFDETIRPLIETTLLLCDEVILLHARHVPGLAQIRTAELGARASQLLDRILLVGGASRTPLVRAELARRYPSVSIELADPEQAVARGAALYSLQHTEAAPPITWLTWTYRPLEHVPAGQDHPGVAGIVTSAGARSLQIRAGTRIVDVLLDASGRFATPAFTLPLGESQLSFFALDEGRHVLEEVSLRVISGGDDLGREGLAHDIGLSLRTQPVVLLRRGAPAGAPSKAEPLYIADISQKIRLPMLEDRYPLGTHEVHLAAEARVGDKVDLTASWVPGKLHLLLQVGGKDYDIVFKLEPRTLTGTLDEAAAEFNRLHGEAKKLLQQPLHEMAGGSDEKRKAVDRLATALRLSLSIEYDPNRVSELLHDLRVVVTELHLFSRSARGISMRAEIIKGLVDDPALRQELQDVVTRTGAGDAVGQQVLDQSEAVLVRAQKKIQMSRLQRPISVEEVKEVTSGIQIKLETLASLADGQTGTADLRRQIQEWSGLLKAFEAGLSRSDVEPRDVYLRALKLSEKVSEAYHNEVVKHEVEGLLSDTAPGNT